MDQNGLLAGQVAVVTGAGSGIGAAVSQRLASMGAKVLLTGRRREKLDRVARTIADARAFVLPCDVTNAESVQELAQQVAKHQRIDILVNNAGVRGPSRPLHELEPREWDTILSTNLRGAYLCIWALTPLMIQSGGGHIINVSSLAGHNPLPNGAAYAASKWALNGLSYSIAEEMRNQKIRVSVVCPGSVDTAFSPHSGQDQSRMLKPDDVAHVVGMLVTQRNESFVSEVLLRPAQKP